MGHSGSRASPLPKSPSAAAVREACLYAFATYARGAWAATGYDRSRGSRSAAAAGPLGQTIAAAADGLWLMGFDGVVRQCGAWAADEFKPDGHVSTSMGTPQKYWEASGHLFVRRRALPRGCEKIGRPLAAGVWRVADGPALRAHF